MDSKLHEAATSGTTIERSQEPPKEDSWIWQVRPSGEKSAAELEEWSKAGKSPKNSELVQVFTP
jgi:hypothetical protein